MTTTAHNTELYQNTNAWPFEQARKLAAYVTQKDIPMDESVLFETGYGPSGLPHIGTFGEVARTVWVQRAFERLTGRPTRLFCFSDDMDGLRKVPSNLPNQEMLQANLNKPLTQVPDPFETHESFAHHNNAKLNAFLDTFGFNYTFKSSTEVYACGAFNNALQRLLECHDAVRDAVRPTLGEERRATYSPFLPICTDTGHVLQVPVLETHPERSSLTYNHPTKGATEVSVLNGACKVQWKADWALRWFALGVDYEMAGKDLIDSVKMSTKIYRILADNKVQPPETFIYEHFVDDVGAKISKSKGNGVTVEQWLRYATPEALSLFMYRQPSKTKKLFLEALPKTVDEYYDLLAKYPTQTPGEQLENPVYHIHDGDVPENPLPCSFHMLQNLVATLNNPTPELVWKVLQRYDASITPQAFPHMVQLITAAIAYFTDVVAPSRIFHVPTANDMPKLQAVLDMLKTLSGNESAEDIQTAFYTVGKQFYDKKELRHWFKFLYTTLFGTENGPRLGGFVTIYGLDETKALVASKLH